MINVLDVCPLCKGSGSSQGNVREQIGRLLQALHVADEQALAQAMEELAAAKHKVAEIENRLNRRPDSAPNLLPSISGLSLVDRPEPTEPSETDAGAGYGEAAVEGQTVESFRNELKDLRAHARAKRMRPQ